MLASTKSLSGATPWRIFVCLLDKWEVGGPLTDSLVYDALKACYHTYTCNPDRNSDVCYHTAPELLPHFLFRYL
jgi:hypothetical protein